MTELTINQALQQAIEAHKAGQVQKADRLYTAILKAQPTHPDANHNMGVLAVGVGKVKQALPFFKTALESNTTTAQFWLSYIEVLIKLERFSDARAVLDQAKGKGAKGDRFSKLEKHLDTAQKAPFEPAPERLEENSTEPNILDSLKLDQAIKLAKKKAKDGSPEEAKQIYQDILVKFPKNKTAKDGINKLAGKTVAKASKVQNPPQNQQQSLINLYSQGQLQRALQEAESLAKQFPKSSILFNIQGAALKGLGQLEQSIEAYKKALAIKPDCVDAYNNMGNTLKEQGKLDEAINSFNKALSIQPDYAKAYFNMGNALTEQGKLDKAIEAYNNALSIKLDYAEAYNNIGISLKDQGKLEEAVEAYMKALAIKPNYANALFNMGNALREQGKLEETIESYSKVLAIAPDYVEAYNNLGVVLKSTTFSQPRTNLHKVIVSLLNKKTYVRPINISPAVINLLKFEPKLKRHLQTSSLASARPKLMETIGDLFELPLLLRLMSVCPLPDLELENLFRELRKSLLLCITDLTGSAEELEIQSALAMQCFTNEYIYNQSEHEDKALKALEAALKQTLNNGDQPNPQSVLCLASYRPLNQYEWSSSLLITDEIEDVFTRQVVEPYQETQFKTVLPLLGDITDEVSSKVRDQYEVSPYPRWVNLRLRMHPAPIYQLVEEIKLKLFDEEIKGVEAPNILIAGCGTGQHSIATAARFRNSKILAIDLSLSSLSYAKRKTKELEIQNIEYMQADILDLGKLGKQFDIVESSGVLHHMDDPLAGWRVLTHCLKPGGLMKIGLYSEIARQHIVKIRREISELGLGSSGNEMRSFRAMMMTSDENHHKQILNSNDFYSLSTLKDLLFHVQEHRFTIPQIQDYLSELGLEFCGFEADHIVSHFMSVNSDANDPYDLNKWQAYEVANPKVFLGMYQLWCQKMG